MIENCLFCGGPMPVESEFKLKSHFEQWSKMCQAMGRCTPCLDKFIDGGPPEKKDDEI